MLSPTRYREIRIWRESDDGHFYIFFCFERLPDGGFLCPYCAAHRNWQFMSSHMDDLDLRHKVFTEMADPHLPVFPTIDEAIDAFDLSRAFIS